MLCLKQPTDGAWTAAAVRDVDALLVDHAHCEMKAASNALSLAARHPGDLETVRALTDLAREEIDHFQRVLAMLAARGVALGPIPVDPYAAELGRAARALRFDPPWTALADRLLVGAIIEARSCERFKLLAGATAGDAGLADQHALWSELLAVEARHHRTFVDLAVRAAGGDRGRVAARLDRLAELEAGIVAAIATRAALPASKAPATGIPAPATGPSRATIHG
jgi:tRNA 2-(methylsulfanyl)-N6-isopentenyladenosine37 hydroxylase